jgi:hypothetical protein
MRYALKDANGNVIRYENFEVKPPDPVGKGWTWQESPEPDQEPEPTPIPAYVTNFQARAALMQIGLFSTVNDAIQSIKDTIPAAWQAWEYANEVGRYGSLTNSLAADVGISEEMLDQLFILAATIEA